MPFVAVVEITGARAYYAADGCSFSAPSQRAHYSASRCSDPGTFQRAMVSFPLVRPIMPLAHRGRAHLKWEEAEDRGYCQNQRE